MKRSIFLFFVSGLMIIGGLWFITPKGISDEVIAFEKQAPQAIQEVTRPGFGCGGPDMMCKVAVLRIPFFLAGSFDNQLGVIQPRELIGVKFNEEQGNVLLVTVFRDGKWQMFYVKSDQFEARPPTLEEMGQ